MKTVQLLAEVTGNVSKIAAPIGSRVDTDDAVLILESMKMEIPVAAPAAGEVIDVLVAEGEAVEEGQPVAVLRVGP
jgi:acetyl-CoA carboxylase biotin carboxyl carrier protein